MTEEQAATIILNLEALVSAAGVLVVYGQRIALLIAWILAAFTWKMLIYAKNQRAWWSILIAVCLSGISQAQETYHIDNADGSPGFTTSGGTIVTAGGSTCPNTYGVGQTQVWTAGEFGSFFFDDVPAGRYEVYLGWCPGTTIPSPNAVTAPWQVRDGLSGSVLASGTVDQTVNPPSDVTINDGVRDTVLEMVAVVDSEAGSMEVRLYMPSGYAGTFCARADQVYLVHVADPDPGPCDGKVWPGHPDWAGLPEGWPNTFQVQWMSGNAAGYFPGTTTTFTWGADLPTVEEIWPGETESEHHEIIAGYSDGKIKIICYTNDYDSGGGTMVHVAAWAVWNSDAAGWSAFWSTILDSEWLYRTECPLSFFCLLTAVTGTEMDLPEGAVAFGYYAYLMTDVAACGFDSGGGGDGGGGTACCCGAIADLVEQMQAEHEQPGETFSGTLPEVDDSPFTVAAVEIPTFADPGRIGSWEIPIVESRLGINTQLYLSTDFYGTGTAGEKVLEVLMLVRSLMLFGVQLVFYSRPLRWLRGL